MFRYLLLILLLLSCFCEAQEPIKFQKFYVNTPSKNYNHFYITTAYNTNNLPAANKSFIPSNFYATHVAFFCREEIKMQKLPIPFTFRMGSFEDCNRLEQKAGTK